jgi:site-specific DNA recombinase
LSQTLRTMRRTEKTLKRCGVYVRVSTEKQVDRQSLSTQTEQLKNYAELHEWQVSKIFCDAGISAKDVQRPALQEMIEWARTGRIDVVLVTKIDRISRNLGDLLQLVDDLQSWGADMVCASQSFDTSTPMGTLSLNILGSFAQFERQMIAERVRENMLERARNGHWNGGVTPFGYALDRESKRLVPDPAASKVVQTAFEEYRRRGSVRGTVHFLNNGGFVRKSGRPWTHTSLKRTLTSRTYIGCIVYGKRAMHRRRLCSQPEERWIVSESAHDPIVDRKLFDEVQGLLGQNETKPGHWRESSPHLLGGLVRCGACGDGVIGTSCTAHGRRYRYYRCGARIRKGASYCGGLSYRAEELETAVVGRLTGMDGKTLGRELRAMQIDTAKELDTLTGRLAVLKTQFEGCRERERKLITLFEVDAIDLELYRGRRREIEAERLALAAEICDLESRAQSRQEDDADPDDVVQRFLEIGETFESLTFEEKRQLLRALVREIVVWPDGKVEISFYRLEGLSLPETNTTNWRECEVCPEGEPKTIGQQLKLYRVRQGLTQKQLASRLGVNPTSLGHWENDHWGPAARHRETIRTKTGLVFVGADDAR